ncbi:hypothetical protein [Virgibacillus halodenitrificans]|uniref:hypothetical protein n=1 Tax=Virgibacillus halodenitrificans TaxID=1482 RepID=UPI000761829C
MIHKEVTNYEKNLETLTTIEDSLVSYYENYLVHSFKEEIVLREVDCWQGRADLVSAKIIGEYNINIEQAELLSKLTNAQIISLLHYKAPRSLRYIVEKLALTETTIKRAINTLKKANIIDTKDNNTYTLCNTFILPNVEFNAYEAKLHNWRRAFYQATQYFGFSHYSWVIMPEKYIKPALKNSELFTENGVGLIGLDNKGKKIVYVKANKNQPRRKAFYLVGVGKAMKKHLNMV